MVHVFEAPGSSEPIRISVRPNGITVSHEASYAFDREGRMLSASLPRAFYKRGLNNRILEKQRDWRVGRPDRVRRNLSSGERDNLYQEVLEALGAVRKSVQAVAEPEVLSRMDELFRWTPGLYSEEAARYSTVYREVGILPPDQYMALVLQATEGCHYNDCTFCSFYRDIPFHVKTPSEFEKHITDVRSLVSRGVFLRRSIFLADANALVLTHSRLVPLFRAMEAQLPVRALGVYSFIDAFTGVRKTREEFEELRELGLRRVYIGMESGHVPLLEFVRKPSMPEAVRELVNTAHEAGVQVSVIALLGIGGHRFAEAHVRDTATLINRLDLRAGDIVYLSEYVEESGSEYRDLALEAGVGFLTGEETHRQAEALAAAIVAPPSVKRAVYDIREFVY